MDFISQVVEQAQAFSWIDWVATITALIYVILAARENIWCWFWGIISCSLWAYASFVFYQLWMDALLQVFYVIMAFVGIYQWKYSQQNQQLRATLSMTSQEHFIYWAVILPATFLFGYFFSNYTPAAASYADAFTTILSVAATIMLVQKKLETWLYWVLADCLYILLYARQGAFLFAILMVIYVGIALTGYFNWKKEMKNSILRQG